MDINLLIHTILDNTDYTFESPAKALDITPSYLKALETGEKPLSHILKKRLASLNNAKTISKKNRLPKKKKRVNHLKKSLNF